MLRDPQRTAVKDEAGDGWARMLQAAVAAADEDCRAENGAALGLLWDC